MPVGCRAGCARAGRPRGEPRRRTDPDHDVNTRDRHASDEHDLEPAARRRRHRATLAIDHRADEQLE